MCWFAFLLCVGLAGPALADEDVAAARRHFEAGTRAFNVGEFDSAAKEYREAYKLKPDPNILYNVAQSYRLAKNAEQALFFYRSYMRNANDPSHRQEIEERIRVLEDQLKQEQAPPNDIVRTAPASDAKPQAKPATETRADLVTSAPPRRKPVYKQWWLWTVTGVAVVGAGLGVGLGLGLKPGAPSTPLGNHQVF
jgi:tetratricopeptide (TPR) repeat protein